MRKQRLVALGLAVGLVGSSLAGCSGGTTETKTASTTTASSGGTQAAATEAAKAEPDELTIFLTNKNIVDGSYAKTYIEEQTNTKLNIIQTTTAELDNKLNITLASGDIPDLIQCETTTMEGQLLESGIFLPLNEYFDQYPNIKNSRSEEIWEKMTYSDGNIYSIGISTQNPLSMIAYRQDWLDLFGMEVPETIDEYYEFAKAVALEDPDGNGKADTFAFGGYQSIDVVWFDHIFGAYGALPNFWMEKDGQIVNGSVDPQMKEALVFLNKMYTEGLLDPEFITDDAKRWQAKVKAGTYGAGVTKIHIFDHNNWSNYYEPFISAYPDGEHVMGPVLQGASDEPVGIRKASDRGWLRTFVYKDGNVDAALRLLDFLTSEEGNKFAQYGLEGEHYEMDGDLLVRSISDEETSELDLNKFFIGNTVLFDHSSQELFDAFEFSKEISIADPTDGIFIDELNEDYPKLEEITNIRYMEMIVGETPIDTGFDAFVQEWNERGGEELVAALNEAYQARQ